jgi:hypothetical protein
MTTTPRPVTDVDRPLVELEAAARKSQPRPPYTPSPEELARRAVAADRLAQEAAEKGLSAEQYAKTGGHATDVHWLSDLDADSTCPLDGACRYPYLTAGGQS